MYSRYPAYSEVAGGDGQLKTASVEAAMQQPTYSYKQQDLEGDQGLPGYTTSTNGPSLTSLALLEEDDDSIDGGSSGKLLSGDLFSWTTRTRSTSSVSSRSMRSFSTPREARSIDKTTIMILVV